jgi:hypothetical protein
MHCLWGFSTLLTINVSTQVERPFVCKKQDVQHMKPFVLQNQVSVTELLQNWQPMELKQGSELELNNSANVGSVIAGDGQLLTSLFQYL